MKIYSDKNVFNAALDRIRFLFDEFENIVVGFSGGKDSTVCLNLSLLVAREKHRLPLKVMFIDQEAEWNTAINYIRPVMSMPEVEPLWFQIPLKLFNATSPNEPWLHCWEPGEKWMREKEPGSIKVNNYNCDRFKELFNAIINKDYPDKSTCLIGGMRAEESPTRFVAISARENPIYKYITWGKILSRDLGHYTFYPLYDWSYTDIWKSIYDNNWPYCKLYDFYYQKGVHLIKMRVSNLHHETAVHALYVLQEIEPDTWNKLTKRLPGINTAGQLKQESFYVDVLPHMFSSWSEYRDYLLDKLIVDQKIKKKFRKKFNQMDVLYKEFGKIDNMHREHVNAILHNDYYFTKIGNWINKTEVFLFRRQKNKEKKIK